MKVAVIYSGVGGANGADYVAEFLAAGFVRAGARVYLCGKHGQGFDKPLPEVDFAVHSSGFDLTPEKVAEYQKTCPLALWTFTDEISWWRDRIGPVSKLVDIHYSYTKLHGWGDHVRYLPLAADPTRYYPVWDTYSDDRRDLNVVMAGAQRHYRLALCEGIGARIPKAMFSWQMGLPVQALNTLYSRAKVVIAPVQDCDEDLPGRAWGCPCRTFDVRATRSFQLETWRAGLDDAYPAAASVTPMPILEEAIPAWCDCIQGFLDTPRLREDMAQQDYEHTLAYHLYQHRAWEMMTHIRALKEVPRG